MEWEQKGHSLLRDEMDFCQGGELSPRTENCDGESGPWGMGNRSKAGKVEVQDCKHRGAASLGKLVWKPSSLGKWKRIAMFATKLIFWFALSYWWRWGFLDADPVRDAKHLLMINICERKGDKARWAKSELQCKPGKATWKPWTKCCTSELFHIWLKRPGFYTLVLISHWMQAAWKWCEVRRGSSFMLTQDSKNHVSWRPSVLGVLALGQQGGLEYLSISLWVLTILFSE